MNPDELPLPIYLNERAVGDLVSILDDGLAVIHEVRESSATIETARRFGNPERAQSSPLGGGRLEPSDSTVGSERKASRHQTMTSLFARMRRRISVEKLIRRESDLDTLEPGQFIEFRASLQKNPIIAIMEWILQMEGILGLVSDQKQKGKHPNQQLKGGKNEAAEVLRFVSNLANGLIEEFSKSGTVELFGTAGSHGNLKVVLTAQSAYFEDQRGDALIDGSFLVLAKTVRVLRTEDDGRIDLLRRTTLRGLNPAVFLEAAEGLRAHINSADNPGFRVPDLFTEVLAPAIQAVPIAIFV